MMNSICYGHGLCYDCGSMVRVMDQWLMFAVCALYYGYSLLICIYNYGYS